jgi:hypothetical protein
MASLLLLRHLVQLYPRTRQLAKLCASAHNTGHWPYGLQVLTISGGNMRNKMLALLAALSLVGCGSGTGRTTGTAAGGAATGAVIGLVGGPIGVVVGAGIGAGVGAMAGANTTPKQVNIGNAPWDRKGN